MSKILLNLTGLVAEIVGVFLMAISLLSGSKSWLGKLRCLLGAIVGSTHARRILNLSESNVENRLTSLRGLLLLLAGFACQALALLVGQ